MIWVVRRPVATWMMTIALIVFGLVSYQRLPLNLMPDLSYPTITIRTEAEGYAPEEVESQVSRAIECVNGNNRLCKCQRRCQGASARFVTDRIVCDGLGDARVV